MDEKKVEGNGMRKGVKGNKNESIDTIRTMTREEEKRKE